ncbi:nucleotidyltransferase family protein [Pseudomonas sp. CCI4.2]|uniref:nucleotidyltransferase family protein n=1 Tax=Pseudomonas sp. CCI4.2 TaxID=3048620 RepID=UPI002AC8A7FC|nr:nucleotidyltransferase family protein [Pseudomonas sp. CCI4.2]MEB0093286.1 nucleotidyltransferase family protein [Pseudomonas sp. CCI4.2]WPX51858.1 nucleotidyltransferase family protein [Pseudomonas sp. CCI4.2]
MSTTVCSVVLAAGQGSRFRAIAGADQDKLLAPCLGLDGVMRPVLEQVLINLQSGMNAGDKRLLLTRPDRLEVIELGRRYGCEIELLDSGGMGDTIAAAISAQPDHRGWLVVLGDMPFVLPETLTRLIDSLEDGMISVPVSGAELGHPVAFGRRFCLALMALSGERGAKRLFQAGSLREIAVNDPGVLWDVDTPAALVFNP